MALLMAFYLLYNYSGEISDDLVAMYAGTSASGYDIKDVIAGPRSTHHRLQASVSEVGIGYYHTIETEIKYLVICRADWMLTQNGTRVRVGQVGLGSTSWSNVSGIDYNPLALSDLIGVRQQDLVISTASAGSTLGGIALSSTPVSGGQSLQVSKVCGCNTLEFSNYLPLIGSVSEMLPPNTYATPLYGYFPYEIEKRFSLTWTMLPMSEVTAFKAVPQIFNWPIFIYDPSATMWDWKLEHVIIESYQEDILEKGNHVLTVNFARLRHYD